MLSAWTGGSSMQGAAIQHYRRASVFGQGPACHSGPPLEPDTSSQTFPTPLPAAGSQSVPPRPTAPAISQRGERGAEPFAGGCRMQLHSQGARGRRRSWVSHTTHPRVAGAGGKSKRSSCNLSAQRHRSNSPLWRKEKSCFCLHSAPAQSSPTAVVRLRLTPSAGKLSNLLK